LQRTSTFANWCFTGHSRVNFCTSVRILAPSPPNLLIQAGFLFFG
jgi:hypothetical protein